MKKGQYEATVWPAGNYRFEVVQAEDTVSKKGNDMLKLKLRLEDRELGEHTVFAYLMANKPRILEQFALSLGWPAETDDFDPAKIEGKTGEVQIGTQDSDEYGTQNTVVAWLEKSPARPAPAATQNRAPLATDRARQQVRANDPPKPAPKTSRAEVSSDDIPF